MHPWVNEWAAERRKRRRSDVVECTLHIQEQHNILLHYIRISNNLKIYYIDSRQYSIGNYRFFCSVFWMKLPFCVLTKSARNAQSVPPYYYLLKLTIFYYVVFAKFNCILISNDRWICSKLLWMPKSIGGQSIQSFIFKSFIKRFAHLRWSQ